MKLKDLPQEILEMIFWLIDSPVQAQHYYEQILVGERNLGTQSEFFRFVITGKQYQSFKRLTYLRQDIPDEVFLYNYAQRSLFSKNQHQQRRSSSSLFAGKFSELRLT
jgi:hypothetical protein